MRWTTDDRNILKNYYYILTPEQLALKLPGRSRKSIVEEVHRLKKRGWAFKK